MDDAYLALLDVPLAAWTDDPRVASAVVLDTDLPTVEHDGPLAVVVTGGAGQLAGPAALAARRGLDVAAYEVSLRDPDDPAGNARRVVTAAQAAGVEDVVVVLPDVEPGYGWLAAADEVAGAELRLGLAGGASFAAWVEAALDRETPFRVVTEGPVDPLMDTVWRAIDGTGERVRARRWLTSARAADAASATSSTSATTR